MKGSGSLVRKFETADIQETEKVVTSQTGFELLCSYNWHTAPVPSIYVPGDDS